MTVIDLRLRQAEPQLAEIAMCTRRDFMIAVGSGSLIGTPAIYAADPAQAPQWMGCLFDAATKADNDIGMGFISDDYVRNLSFRSTCDGERNAEVNEILFRISQEYGLGDGALPTFKFIAPGTPQSKVAFAKDGITINSGTMGLVAMGLDLFETEWHFANGPLAVEVILAHEFAHLVQLRTNLSLALLQTGAVEWLELHADFVAGWCMGRMSTINLEQLKFVVDPMFRRGDHRQDAAQHHGTPDQRFTATIQGFLFGPSTDSVIGAATQGLDFIRSMQG